MPAGRGSQEKEEAVGVGGELCFSLPREARTLMYAVNPDLLSVRKNEKKERSDLFPSLLHILFWGLQDIWEVAPRCKPVQDHHTALLL